MKIFSTDSDRYIPITTHVLFTAIQRRDMFNGILFTLEGCVADVWNSEW